MVSSMNDDVVPSVRSPKLGPTEKRMSDLKYMQVKVGSRDLTKNLQLCT